LITGHVIASVARNLLSALLVFAVAVAIGFRSDADLSAWLGAIAVLALFVTALTWLAAALGIMARSAEAASGMTFIFAFLTYPSSAFVPIATMPGWLQGFARHQPFTPAIDTIRGLLATPIGSNAWQTAAWSVAIIAGSIPLAGALYRCRTR
jgi:ABC-2 type transport system permease protein